MTSSAGIKGTIGQINYTAAKSGIIGMTKSAAKELGRYNITVNCIAPSAITRMTEKIFTDPKFKDKYLEAKAVKRFAEAREMVPTFVFFASDDSNYISGQVLSVDGGVRCKNLDPVKGSTRGVSRVFRPGGCWGSVRIPFHRRLWRSDEFLSYRSQG